jgi:hypothetical protein
MAGQRIVGHGRMDVRTGHYNACFQLVRMKIDVAHTGTVVVMSKESRTGAADGLTIWVGDVVGRKIVPRRLCAKAIY